MEGGVTGEKLMGDVPTETVMGRRGDVDASVVVVGGSGETAASIDVDGREAGGVGGWRDVVGGWRGCIGGWRGGGLGDWCGVTRNKSSDHRTYLQKKSNILHIVTIALCRRVLHKLCNTHQQSLNINQ